MRNNFNKGFTLVELLAVVAILATIVTATVVVMNPVEMLQQAEDAVRLNDINSIHQVLTLFRSQRPGGSIGEPNIVYVSIPSASSTCVGAGLPALPTGWEYRCVPAERLRRIDGNGWIPVNFAAIPGRIPFTILPIDPVNTAASGSYYAFVTDRRTWALATMTRSRRHSAASIGDGGTDFARFEAGTNLSLWTSASGLVGYWSFDEGTGTTARDLSGRGNTGTLQPTLGPPTWISGRVGGALSFDGVDDFIALTSQPPISGGFTFKAWVKRKGDSPSTQSIFNNNQFFLRTQPEVENPGNPFESFVRLSDGSVEPRAPSGVVATTEQWFYVTVTWDKVTLRIYVNGVLRSSSTRTMELTSTTAEARIGRGQMTSVDANPFNGLIDEVRIYNRALSATEIMANFNATR